MSLAHSRAKHQQEHFGTGKSRVDDIAPVAGVVVVITKEKHLDADLFTQELEHGPNMDLVKEAVGDKDAHGLQSLAAVDCRKFVVLDIVCYTPAEDLACSNRLPNTCASVSS